MNKLGRDHVYVATTYSNLGSVYQELGDFKQAKKFHRGASTYEDADVSNVLENMVTVEQENGKQKMDG